jgi:hypothetical protein
MEELNPIEVSFEDLDQLVTSLDNALGLVVGKPELEAKMLRASVASRNLRAAFVEFHEAFEVADAAMSEIGA